MTELEAETDSYELEFIGVIKWRDSEALRIRATYQVLDMSIRVIKTYALAKGGTIVASCEFLADRVEVEILCQTALDSLAIQ